MHRPLHFSLRLGLLVLLVVLGTLAGIGHPLHSTALAASNEVLILGSTVSGGTTSLEAQEVTAKGFTPVVVDDATWESMTTAQFASYRAIVIGDPRCGSYNDTSHLTAALANPSTWGAAVNGNVLVIGTDPVFHSGGTLTSGPGKLISHGIDFALAQTAKTGAYVDLSCAYGEMPANTPLTLLDGIRPGGFKVDGGPSSVCYNDAHIVATHPALAGLTDADLSNWSCSVHEAFDTWPADYTVLAMARNYGSSYTSSDGTVGTPYILASGLGLHSYPLSLDPPTQTIPVGGTATVTAQLLDAATGLSKAGTAVSFRVSSGPNAGTTGTCGLPGCLTDSSGHVSWSYSGAAVGGDTVQAWLDTNGDGSPSPGEPQTTAAVTWNASTSCTQAGQMVTDSPLQYDAWAMHYGISKCEGLVISGVTLGSRLMAERMSLPYLDLVTCSGRTGGIPSSVSGCGLSYTRHITLRQSDNESQSDPSLYTHVQLISNSVSGVAAATYSPCNGQSPCEHISIKATYRVDLTPSTGTAADQYLLVTQNYEFYRDFSEHKYPQLACEPSQQAPHGIGLITSPLSDCARWKPLVTYQYNAGNSSQILVSLNAAERLHFTPDSLAVRASTLARDCDTGTPVGGCQLRALELYPPSGSQNPIQNEAVIRGVQATDSGTVGNNPGRYDNLHLTPADHVALPLPRPPGCEECVHIHWRWGADTSTNGGAQFGSGQPLVGDGEPAAVPNAVSRQQLDVGVVAYHSEELSPRNFLDIIKGSNPGALDMHLSTSDSFTGGYSMGSETLNYPSGSCLASYAPASWGQCGEVVWLSATAFTNNVNISGGDEDSDTLFAFGGFFCKDCGNPNYSLMAKALQPSYAPNIKAVKLLHPGEALDIAFLKNGLPQGLNLAGHVGIYDILPAGMTNVSFTINKGQVPLGITCVLSSYSASQQLAHCDIPATAGLVCPAGPCITIHGTMPTQPGVYQNLVHAVWGDSSTNSEIGGNMRLTDDITVGKPGS